jgi:hypothetical protein
MVKMKKVRFSVESKAAPPRREEGDPKALIEAISILEEKVEDLSKRAENLLHLVASVR